jgi:hypothetical protein
MRAYLRAMDDVQPAEDSSASENRSKWWSEQGESDIPVIGASDPATATASSSAWASPVPEKKTKSKKQILPL